MTGSEIRGGEGKEAQKLKNDDFIVKKGVRLGNRGMHGQGRGLSLFHQDK